MRKRILRKCQFFFLIFLAILVTGCGQYKTRNRKADDAISKAIYEKIGKKAYYEGKKTRDENVMVYHYLIRDSKDESVIVDIVETVNKELEKDNKEKIFFCIYEEVPGGETPIATMRNYGENEVVASENKYLKYIIIYGNEIADYSSYNQASFYPTMEGIEYLEVIDKVNQSAEDEGIDWYEVFPDLKGYEVFVRREKDGTYNPHVIYQEMRDSEETEEESLLEP